MLLTRVVAGDSVVIVGAGIGVQVLRWPGGWRFRASAGDRVG